MKPAAFSIKDYVFDKVNIDLSNYNSDDISIDFQTHGIFSEENSGYELIFSISVFTGDEIKNKPFAYIQCRGMFEFENVSSFEEIPDYFYSNSIAILFPYVRAYVSMVTTQANVRGIILPTLNLSSLEDDLRKNTIQK